MQEFPEKTLKLNADEHKAKKQHKNLCIIDPAKTTNGNKQPETSRYKGET